MKLEFVVHDLEYSARMMNSFVKLSHSFDGKAFKGMGDTILALYPELDGNELKELSETEMSRYIEEKLRDKYDAAKPEMLSKLTQFQESWDAVAADVEKAFKEIFSFDTENSFNRMLARINMNPIGPRFLEDHSFDIFYLYSDKGAIAVALHEITHFVWFEVWHKLFNDGYELYEQPHLPWIISELAIDAILTDRRLNRFIENERVANQPAYPEFYEIETSQGRLIDIVRELYAANSMGMFMQKTLEFCKQHEGLFSTHFS